MGPVTSQTKFQNLFFKKEKEVNVQNINSVILELRDIYLKKSWDKRYGGIKCL
jgi:hypothetical protein